MLFLFVCLPNVKLAGDGNAVRKRRRLFWGPSLAGSEQRPRITREKSRTEATDGPDSQCHLMHAYSGVNPTVCMEAYSLVSVHRRTLLVSSLVIVKKSSLFSTP